MTRDEAINVLESIATMYPKSGITKKKAEVLIPPLLEMEYAGVMAKLSDFAATHPFVPTIAEIAVYPKLPNEHLDKIKKWQVEAGKVSDQTKQQFRIQLKKLMMEKTRHEKR